MARYERSGLQQAAFCAREEIALHTFKNHYRPYKAAAPQLGQFVEAPPLTPPRRELELELPNGIRLQVRGAGQSVYWDRTDLCLFAKRRVQGAATVDSAGEQELCSLSLYPWK